MILTFTAEIPGKTVYTYARRELSVSASLLRRLKNADAIRVNGERAFTDRVLDAGDTLTLDLLAAEPPCGIVPEKGELDVLWENDGLLAVSKPCGLIVHPSHSRYTGTLANFVAGYLPGGICHAVNRLDRDTSGVVLFAKCSHWKERAAAALAESGEKEYLALVCGTPEPLRGTISAPIKRLREHELLRVVAEDGQSAVTHYETLASDSALSLVRLYLETGRTHQIRVHMLHIGNPLLGDIMYKTDASEKLSAALGVFSQALHARRLSFTDPVSGARTDVTAPVNRSDMAQIIAGFGSDI